MPSPGSAPRALLRRSLRCSHPPRSLRSLGSQRLALAFVLLALLAAPAVHAQRPPPDGVAMYVSVGERGPTLALWIELDGNVTEEAPPGANVTIWFALERGTFTANETRRVVFLNLTDYAVPSQRIIPSARSLVLEVTNASEEWTLVSIPAQVAANATPRARFDTRAEAYADNGTGDLQHLGWIGIGDGVDVIAPVPPGIPRSWLLAGIAVLVVGGLGSAIALRQRAIKRRMNEGPRRSQVMRELELEHKLEKAKAKDPEGAVVIQKEIRQAEQVREKRRELQILEAKRADALKTIDLLKKRHESGGLTKLQYDNMVGKKRADLERIEAEIAEMERQDSGSAA